MGQSKDQKFSPTFWLYARNSSLRVSIENQSLHTELESTLGRRKENIAGVAISRTQHFYLVLCLIILYVSLTYFKKIVAFFCWWPQIKTLSVFHFYKSKQK